MQDRVTKMETMLDGVKESLSDVKKDTKELLKVVSTLATQSEQIKVANKRIEKLEQKLEILEKSNTKIYIVVTVIALCATAGVEGVFKLL